MGEIDSIYIFPKYQGQGIGKESHCVSPVIHGAELHSITGESPNQRGHCVLHRTPTSESDQVQSSTGWKAEGPGHSHEQDRVLSRHLPLTWNAPWDSLLYPSCVPTRRIPELSTEFAGLSDSNVAGRGFPKSRRWDCGPQPGGKSPATRKQAADEPRQRAKAVSPTGAQRRCEIQACAIPTQKNPGVG